MKTLFQVLLSIASTFVYMASSEALSEKTVSIGQAEVSYELQSEFGDLDEIANRGMLRVLVTHSKTDFFIDQGRIRGIQAEYVEEFLRKLNKDRTNGSNAGESHSIVGLDLAQ